MLLTILQMPFVLSPAADPLELRARVGPRKVNLVADLLDAPVVEELLDRLAGLALSAMAPAR